MKAEKRGLKGATRTQGRLTQPQIPIRFGSTYDFLAQALQKFVAKKKEDYQSAIRDRPIKKKKEIGSKNPSKRKIEKQIQVSWGS